MAEPASIITPLTTDESRCQQRTHLFVAATLYFEGGTSPVHIRNISPTGALIEGLVLPEQGATATLKRGSLQAAVRIVWKAEHRAGVSFSSTAHVADWMSRTPPPHQARIDNAVRSFRSGRDEGPSPADQGGGLAETAIEAELNALKCELAEIEAGLIQDVIVVATHPEIQLLDVAQQRVERILARLRPA